MMREMPEPWAWDEHDLLVTDDKAEQAAARHADVVKAQVDSFADEDYLMALYTSGSISGKKGRHE